jgi:hypothetical protein
LIAVKGEGLSLTKQQQKNISSTTMQFFAWRFTSSFGRFDFFAGAPRHSERLPSYRSATAPGVT